MSGLKKVVLLIILIVSTANAVNNQNQYNSDKLYKEALRYYQIKSYYSALTNLYKITKNKKDPYYVPASYLLAKVYIRLGKKTGIKKYFSSALYLLNIYMAYKKKVNWDYYYTKANLFEAWGFYERAMFFYKTSLFMTKNKDKYFKSLIGILRTTIWFNKLDILTYYAIKLSVKDLLKKENNSEIRFLKGLLLFNQKKYDQAYKYLYTTYKKNEEYLIDNPEFYYIVAENMYRIKKYNFAKQLFRRIISITQNLEIIRKSILRLGDIEITQKDYPSAFNHYYYLATDYKKTKEAIIAKLKIIAYSDIKEFNKRISKSQDEDFKEPLKFIIKTLVLYRNTTLGRYALSDFGKIVFRYNSEFLYKKLGWELSILEVERMSYEEQEFFKNLWRKPLVKINSKWLCHLYQSNKKFFLKVFDKNYLLNLSDKMLTCPKNIGIDFLMNLLNIYKDDTVSLKLALAYYNLENYQKSLEILSKIKKKDCKFYILLLKNYVMMDNWKKLKNSLKFIKNCKNPEKDLIYATYNLNRSIIVRPQTTLLKYIDLITKNYKKPFYQKLIYLEAEKLLYYGRYKSLFQVISRLAEVYKEDCDLNSWILITNIRTGNYKDLEKQFNKISACESRWALVAKSLYEDFLVERRFKK